MVMFNLNIKYNDAQDSESQTKLGVWVGPILSSSVKCSVSMGGNVPGGFIRGATVNL